MTKLQIGLIGTVMMTGLAVAIVIQRRSQATFLQNEAALRQVDDQLAELTAEHQRLTNQLVNAASSGDENATNELARLREQAEVLRKQITDLTQEREKNNRPQKSKEAARPASHPPEYYEQLHKIARGKCQEALAIGFALRMYAQDHQGQIPSKLDSLTPYLRKEKVSLSGTNEFEIVYQGSLDALAKIPISAVALLRDRQIWLAPSGKKARLYGIADGSARIVESDDDFESWEAEHIVRVK